MEAALRKEVLRQVRDIVAVYAGPGAGVGRGKRDDEVLVGFDQSLRGCCADTCHPLTGAWNSVLVSK